MSWVWVALADGVVALHFGYLAVLCFGGVAARWWRRLLGLHLAAVVWAVGAVTVRYDCPLTSLEDGFRRRAGQIPAPEGFLRHNVRGVLFPERLTPWVVAGLAAVIVAGWLGLARRALRPAWTGGARTPAAARR
jgi:hypothetical protein